MNLPIVFQNTSIQYLHGDVTANRKQIQELYNVPRKTLADNINALKTDGLVNGAKIRHVAKDGKQRIQEVFDLDEIISIGFRLRSDRAIYFQKWARETIKKQLLETIQKFKINQALVDALYDKEDRLDLIPKWG